MDVFITNVTNNLNLWTTPLRLPLALSSDEHPSGVLFARDNSKLYIEAPSAETTEAFASTKTYHQPIS